MKKILTLIFCIIIPAGALSAQQTGRLRGILVDEKSKEPIIGAVIEISNNAVPDDMKAYTTAADGLVSINGLSYGEYSVKLSFLGYADIVKTVNINSATVDMGTLQMAEDRIRIQDVEIEVPAIRTSIKGDTVSYHAGAFKVSSDSDTERLISKMPGITVIDGTVEAQGEEVKKVLVDGREFFGQDVTTALKSVPAEMVDKIEVFDKLSDQAEFTGIDDGQGYKAINIVTSLDKRSGQFGKIAASYGYPDYYYGNAAVNIFSGDTRVSLLGLLNNLNQQNFSFEDIVGATATGGSAGGGRMGGASRSLMVRPQSGLATVQAFGVNYMDKWGENNKVDVTASYFFNHTNTVNENSTERWFENLRMERTEYTESQSNTTADNMNHRFNGRIEYKIKEGQSLMVRPSFSYQDYDYSSDGRRKLTYLYENAADEWVHDLRSVQNNKRYGYDAGLNILFRTRLGKPGRTLTVNLDGNLGLNNSNNIPENYFEYPSKADSTGIQWVLNDSRSYRLNGSVTYSEPLSQKSSLNLEYRANYNYSDSDQRTFDYLSTAADGHFLFDDDYNMLLSNIANSGYLTQRINPGYSFNGEKINFNVNAGYQNARLVNTQEIPVPENGATATHIFDNFLYSARIRYNINRTNSLNLFVNSDTRNPSISQLQNVVRFSESTISGGNPDLIPTYNHRLRAHYNLSNMEKGSTFGVFMGGNITSNYIANHTVTQVGYIIPNYDGERALEKGEQYTRPENIDGYWSLNAGVSFGFPVKWLKSNFNVMLGGSLGQTPSKTDDIVTIRNGQGIFMQASLGSNISENLDFMLSYRGSYERNAYSAKGTTVNADRISTLFNHFATASIKWTFWKGITFNANATFRQYYRPTENTNEQYFICNALIGKKIFKNQRGEISLMVNDIFNQNKAYYTSVTENAITNSRNLEIGRYVGLQFVYNLRLYGKGASRRSSDYDGLDQPGTPRSAGPGMRFGPGMGSGPGGPPPGR